MPASFDPNHITKLQQLYSFITGVWGKCKNLFATKTELQEAIESIPDPLPEATSADEGKVLTVDSNGDPEWSEPPNPQVQADWSQTDSSAVDYIKNKPTLAAIALSGSWNDLQNIPSGLVIDALYNHTDENFTAALKSKLDGIAAGAEVNVQSDWNQTTTTADDYIKNKPSNLVQDASYVHTDNNFTTALKNKLDGIASGAEVNVQSDWSQTDTTSDDYIKNKPENLVQDASYVHTDNNFTTALKDKLDGIAAGAEVNVQSDWDQTDTNSDDYIKNKPATKALLAGSGVSITETAEAVTISATAASQVQADWDETDPSDPSYIQNKPTIPVVPTTDQTYDANSSNPQSGMAVADAIAGVNQVPASTSGDSGKVLTVNSSGSPEWQTGGGGGSSNVVILDSDNISATYATLADMLADIQAGKVIIIHVASLDKYFYYYMTDSIGPYFVNFSFNTTSSGIRALSYSIGKFSSSMAFNYDSYSGDGMSPRAWITPSGAMLSQYVPVGAHAEGEYIFVRDSYYCLKCYKCIHAYTEAGSSVKPEDDTTHWSLTDLATVLNELRNSGGSGTQQQADWTQTDSTAADYIKNKPNLATVATSGSYNDLSNKPTIPAAGESAWNYTQVNITQTGSGTSHRFVINEDDPVTYQSGGVGYTHEKNYSDINIQENANAAKHDWIFKFSADYRHNLKLSIYDSTNSLSTRYIMIGSVNIGTSASYQQHRTITYGTGQILVNIGYLATAYGRVTVMKRGTLIFVYT